jgi:UDP-N-acetylglucosamine acyltransferase
MTQIHPTALVDPKAELADDVTVGPFSIVGPNVRIGSGTRIGSHTTVEGHTTIGAGNRIGPYASVGGVPQDMKYANEPTQLVIGDRNTIREFTTIHTGTVQDRGVTSLGNDNWIMAYVHIAHDCSVGNHTVFSSNAQIAGHVEVGDWAILGGMSGVHQFVRIGAHAMLGGASALVQDVPPSSSRPATRMATRRPRTASTSKVCVVADSMLARSRRCVRRTSCCTSLI